MIKQIKFVFWFLIVVTMCLLIGCGKKRPPILVEFLRSEFDKGPDVWMKYSNSSHNETLKVHYFSDGKHFHSAKMLPGSYTVFRTTLNTEYEINVEGYEASIKGVVKEFKKQNTVIYRYDSYGYTPLD